MTLLRQAQLTACAVGRLLLPQSLPGSQARYIHGAICPTIGGRLLRPTTAVANDLQDKLADQLAELQPSSALTIANQQLEQRRYQRFPTVKRRKNHPLRWWKKHESSAIYADELDTENKSLLKELYDEQRLQQQICDQKGVWPKVSPLKSLDQDVTNKDATVQPAWTPRSHRSGVITRKLGVLPIWLKDGTRVACTLLQVRDCHVINYFDIEQTRKEIIHQDRWKTDGYATMVVGAESEPMSRVTPEYAGLFQKAGVLPKKKLSKFVITEDARLTPGTTLHVCHFKVGQFVDVFGRSTDRGFQGVVKRWGFKGDGRKHHGATKFHRRGGSISQGRKAGGPMKGRRMPGHMGNERRTVRGLKILRIDTKHSILWISGQNVPGPIGNWVYVFDTIIAEKKFDPNSPPPFPTYYEKPGERLPQDIYHSDVHVMDKETIMFVETEEEKRAAARRSGAKLAKVRKK